MKVNLMMVAGLAFLTLTGCTQASIFSNDTLTQGQFQLNPSAVADVFEPFVGEWVEPQTNTVAIVIQSSKNITFFRYGINQSYTIPPSRIRYYAGTGHLVFSYPRVVFMEAWVEGDILKAVTRPIDRSRFSCFLGDNRKERLQQDIALRQLAPHINGACLSLRTYYRK